MLCPTHNYTELCDFIKLLAMLTYQSLYRVRYLYLCLCPCSCFISDEFWFSYQQQGWCLNIVGSMNSSMTISCCCYVVSDSRFIVNSYTSIPHVQGTTQLWCHRDNIVDEYLLFNKEKRRKNNLFQPLLFIFECCLYLGRRQQYSNDIF